MHRFEIIHGKEAIETDVCGECGRIWLDAGEGARLKDLADAVHRFELESVRARVSGSELQTFQHAVRAEDGLLDRIVAGRARRRPFATVALLLAIGLLYLGLGPSGSVDALAIVPVELLDGRAVHTLITHAFGHASLGHLFCNSLYLWFLGRALEKYLGPGLFLGLYASGLLGAAALHLLVHSSSSVPALGASGALSGLLAAVLVLAPKMEVLWSWSPHQRGHMKVQVAVAAATWLAYQLASQLLGAQGVGWFAHIGGFLSGGATMWLFMRLRLADDPAPGPARAPSPPSTFSTDLSAEASRFGNWVTENPAVSIPLGGVLAMLLVVGSIGLETQLKCSEAKGDAHAAWIRYVDHVRDRPSGGTDSKSQRSANDPIAADIIEAERYAAAVADDPQSLPWVREPDPPPNDPRANHLFEMARRLTTRVRFECND